MDTDYTNEYIDRDKPTEDEPSDITEEKGRLDRENKAAQEAREQLKAASPASPDHPYLKAKGVKPCEGLKQDDYKLLAPMVDKPGGYAQNLQRIFPDGEKKFWPGARTKGCFFHIPGDPNGPLVICEGVATGLSVHAATRYEVWCAMGCEKLKAVAEAARRQWPERIIILAADDDRNKPKNPGLTKAKAAAWTGQGKVAWPRFRGERPEGATDFNDLHQAEGLEAVRRCFEDGALIDGEPDKDAEIKRLVELQKESPALYGAECKRLAGALGCSVSDVKAEVKLRTPKEPETDQASGGGESILFDPVEPWEQPVDGQSLLGEIAAAIRRYVYLLPHAAETDALFTLYSYCWEKFDVATYLQITSPTKRCGKSLVLRLLSYLCHKPLLTSNITDAALARVVNEYHPLLLLDEMDRLPRDREALQALFNAGNERETARSLLNRPVPGGDWAPDPLDTFGPKVFAGIGRLSDTLEDRCITIRMQRKPPNAKVKRFRRREFKPLAEELNRKCARWAQDHAAALGDLEPEIPDALNHRAADVWEPLLAVAELVGGPWPEKARQAAVALSGEGVAEDDDWKTQLLKDIAKVWEKAAVDYHKQWEKLGVDYLEPCDMCNRLVELDESPWATWNKGRQFTPHRLARVLKEFGIYSRRIRADERIVRAYLREDFLNAWSIYTPQSVNTFTSTENKGQSGDFEVSTGPGCEQFGNATLANNDRRCERVDTFSQGNGGVEEETDENQADDGQQLPHPAGPQEPAPAARNDPDLGPEQGKWEL